MADFASCSTNVADISPDDYCQGFGGCGGAGIQMTSENMNGVLALIQDQINLGLVDGKITDVELVGTNLVFVGNGGAFSGIIDMSTITGSAVPVGGIIMWSGAVSPGGWALCDGTAGTPDLRDRFVVGSGSTYTIGDTGGANSHDHGAVTGNHALTRAQLPIINDLGNGVGDQITTAMIYGTKPASAPDNMNNDSSAAILQGLVEPFGGDQPHNHSIAAGNNLPPYYALAYIMKL